VFRDGQGEGGGIDLEVEPVGRIDRVVVQAGRLDPGDVVVGTGEVLGQRTPSIALIARAARCMQGEALTAAPLLDIVRKL
jgi:hypothetical protein